MPGLRGHHRLGIQYCAYNLSGYESLIGVHHIKLEGCDIWVECIETCQVD